MGLWTRRGFYSPDGQDPVNGRASHPFSAWTVVCSWTKLSGPCWNLIHDKNLAVVPLVKWFDLVDQRSRCYSHWFETLKQRSDLITLSEQLMKCASIVYIPMYSLTRGYLWETKKITPVQIMANQTSVKCCRSPILLFWSVFVSYSVGIMSDKSELKAELERKKQRLAQIREEKKRKEDERKKKEVSTCL